MNLLSLGVLILMTCGFSLAPANVNGITLINCRRDEEENVVQNHYLLTMFRFTAAIYMRLLTDSDVLRGLIHTGLVVAVRQCHQPSRDFFWNTWNLEASARTLHWYVIYP